MSAFVSRRMVYAQWSSLDHTSERNPPSQEDESLIHRNEDGTQAADLDEKASLITNGDGEEPSPSDFVKQPDLSRTSIVGQSREACGQKTSVYVAISMVASALCLALAQMMVCAAILDSMMITLAGKTCALGFPGESSSWVYCSTDASMKPFSTTDAPMSLISVGTVLAASGGYFLGLRGLIDFRLTVVPLSVCQAAVAMGSVELDDIIHVQYCLFSFLAASVFRFSYVMNDMAQGIESLGEHLEETRSEVSWLVGPFPFRSVGPIMFSFAFIGETILKSCVGRIEVPNPLSVSHGASALVHGQEREDSVFVTRMELCSYGLALRAHRHQRGDCIKCNTKRTDGRKRYQPTLTNFAEWWPKWTAIHRPGVHRALRFFPSGVCACVLSSCKRHSYHRCGASSNTIFLVEQCAAMDHNCIYLQCLFFRGVC